MQDDWFVRAYFESKRVISNGGAVWVPILTYRNEDLPTYDDDEYNFHCPCFDPEHFVAFRNKLRIYLKRSIKSYNKRHGTRFNHTFKDETTIRYIYCCEYGERRGRSHIHVLLFVPTFVPHKIMKDCIDRAWIYGMVRYSKKGLIAKGMQAAKYCMKYVSKDMNWYNKYHVDEYISNLKSDIDRLDWVIRKNLKLDINKLGLILCTVGLDISECSGYECLQEELYNRLKTIKRVRPHHHQSMGFGIDGIKYYCDESGCPDFNKCVDGHISATDLEIPPVEGKATWQYNMPAYYERKLLYYCDEHQLYTLTQFGLDVLMQRYENTLHAKAESFMPYFCDRDVFDSWMAPIKGDIDSDAVWQKIVALRGDSTPFDFANYCMVYKDVAGTEYNECLISDMDNSMSDSECLKLLNEYAFDFYYAQKSALREPDPKNVKVRPRNSKIYFGFNDLPCYHGFKELYMIITDLEYKIGKCMDDAYKLKREQDERLKATLDDPYAVSTIYVAPFSGVNKYVSLNSLLGL